ncbi:chaoptin-like [Plodia interpunctella]|uniref:chaoptin-like n=1 Tax=Plodia interpunctella TaxID=58824 RepID=UPI0023677CE2|nr:chaoptin-like [Plodia interpunctella]XP_053608071.1 chaoptin-like [Plodia interpunctella]
MVLGYGCARWALQKAALVACLLVGTLAPERLEPCATSPLCSCREAHMSCIAVPLHRFPDWPRMELQHLDISLSNLEVLTESALDGLRLQTLVLVANKLHYIELHSFSSMATTLASLDLGYNEFTEIPQQGLRDLKVLNWLNLQNNNIAHLGPEIRWHHLEETLTSISLSNNQITQLKSQSLTSLYRLVQLDLEGNYLRSIRPDSLPSTIKILKLSNNFLHELSCDLIFNLPKLQSLHVRHNFVKFDNNTSCSSSKNRRIEKLDLSNNKINDSSEIYVLLEVQIRQIILDLNELTFVPRLVFANNRVEKLSVSYNKLTSIHRDLFLSLKNSLEHLEVEHNKLSQLPDSLGQVARLRHLSLAYNQLDEAPPLPSRIQTLSLAGNFLTSIPSALQTLEPGSIRYLDLSYNRISNLLPNEFLDWSTSLGTINLRGNRIAQIYKNVFPPTMLVKEINLSFNDLYYIHPQSFSNITGSLHVLESSSTLFSGYFPFEIEGLENLSLLSFDNNDFHILKLSDLITFPFLKYLNLDYNRIVDIVIGENYQNISLPVSNIRLAYNFLSSIHIRTFTYMTNLRNLDLSYNRINNLTKHSFTNLPNLRYLSLAGNIIDSMEVETFANLPKLEILELQGNNLSYLSLNSFCNVSHPDVTFTLNVSRNHLRFIDGESTISVNILDGSYNELYEVPNNFFIAVESSIRQIILSHNKITYVSSEAFGDAIHLEILDLHKNGINTLRRKSFSELVSLQILDLSYNVISQLSVEQFYNLNKLRYLKLEHNSIRLLPRDVFKNTIIEHLDLSYNDISLFPVTALSQIGFTLRFLDLSNNRIEYLDSNIFRNTQFLLNLNLGNNLLTVLSDNTFSSVGGLRRLDLSSNSIKANFKELFHNLPNLRHLNLANVSLKSVPYLPLTNLTSLNLTSNYINSFKETDVKRLVNLRHLDLSHNRLTSLVPKMWFHLNNLNVLDISYNPIVRITPNSFKWLSNLSHLNLNGLKYLDIIDQDSFRPLISLRVLHLQSWSKINHSTFRLSNVTSSLPSLYKLIIHWADDTMDTQLHGIDARNIRYLEIKGVSLRRIADEAFESFSNNQEIFIRITETSLTKLPTAFMKHLGQIPQLGVDLSYNQITTVNPAIFYPNFTSWSQVATKLLSGGLILSGNPLRCECSLAWLGAWLRRWLQENEAGSELQRAVRSATCRDQLGRRVPLLQLRADEAECHASALSSDAQPNYTDIVYTLVAALWTILLR